MEAFFSGILATQYGKFRNNKLVQLLADRFVFLYISQWYVLLTSYLLPDTVVQVDILSVNDILYQGELSEYFLKDGELSGIILTNPKRFNRKPYLKEKEEGRQPDKKDYWVSIPSAHLYFFAEKILNINLSYINLSGQVTDSSAVERFLAEQIGTLAGGKKLTIKSENPPSKSKRTPNKTSGSKLSP
jgi:hypothetical protein